MTLCVECPLDSRDIDHPICVPQPSDLLKGCIISRDPTFEFIAPLKKYKNGGGNFQFNAPPLWLYERIQYFTGFEPGSDEMKKLKTFLNLQCYWTHFHKCPTNKNEHDFRFKYSNGERCADIWFNSEVLKYNLKQKIVVLLGRDLQTYFQRNSNHQLLQNNHVIYLPHPSSVNCGTGWSWNKDKPSDDKYKIQVEEEIDKLLSLIGG
jgi:hypothetical protein